MNLFHLTMFEIKKLIISKTSWILIAIFVALANTATFFIGGFLVLNEASLNAFLRFLPLSIVLFSFLISFNSNIKESKKQNFIKFASLPIGLGKLTIAKYLANLSMGVIFLILSLSIVITINYLGTPDYLLVLSGYIAALLLFMLCFAITTFTNTIAKNSFESLGYSILIIFAMAISSLGALEQILASILPDYLVQNIAKYSILSSYNNIGSGFIGINDLVLYLSYILFFMISSLILCNRQVINSKYSKLKVFILFSTTLIINGFFINSSFKFDLTSDKVYSISEQLVNITKKLSRPSVQVIFYYSKTNESIPIEYRKYADYVTKYLKQLENVSKGSLKVIFKNPELSSDIEIMALQNKVAEIPLPGGDGFYAGITVKQNNILKSMPYIDLKRKHFLEYDIAEMLVNFTKNTRTKKIGIITDLDLGKKNQQPEFMLELMKRYDVDIIPVGYPTFPQYDLVISFMTPFMEDETIYGLDQYLVNGGRVLVFLDPLFRTAPEKDFLMPDRKADDSAFDHIADLLRFYGINYDYNKVVGDKTRALSSNIDGIGLTSYPLWVYFSEKEMNQSSPIFAGLNNIIIPEGGFFNIYDDLLPTLTYTPLLTTTSESQVLSRSLFSELLGDSKAVASRLKGEKKSRDVSFMLNGEFASAFRRMPDKVKYWFDGAESVAGKPKYPEHKIYSDKKGVLIAVADMDFMSDQFSTYLKTEIDGSKKQAPSSDNQFYLKNMIDYVLGDYDLINIRGKGATLRTLEKVEENVSKDIATKEFQENSLVRLIQLAGKNYESLTKRKSVIKTQEQFDDIQLEIFKSQSKIVNAKRNLRIYKRSLKQNVETYARNIAILNILFAPIILLILGLVFFYIRKRSFR